ncbi:Ig-like domain-containing alpha-2-macroglobulin family protein [Pseudobacteroides cellulosolvens]|uniref:Alpha-2-macroglobulin domain protein 2 n=1 Tax=Pseudobacteroides cellulosolvens ATCC 35603 = DSM 2933 TaxID=398512 RepID=A0A0L6JQY0_9FIRM|nr:Ig-like domain-containing alpha-2-macroglobulin family protein [Pseudobacteroides cellulosolvens]KNY28115.1 alpha-2-macroglobulin domain protein 2 [Pseudobacteroides cellulosolvens ATCC 35603 = DSM 2933]
MNIKDLYKSNKFAVTAIIVATVIFVAITAFAVNRLFFKSDYKEKLTFNSQTTKAEKVVKITNIEPLSYDGTGVEVNSGFKVTSEKECDESYIKKALKITPNVSFAVKKLSATSFSVKADEPLVPNSVYKFEALQPKPSQDGIPEGQSSNNYSWAFQTKKTFRVVRTLPRDMATNVETNTGIEITMSHENFEEFDKYFEISPKVKGRFEYHKKVAVFVPEKLEPGMIYTVTLKKGLGLRDGEDKLERDYIFKFQTNNPQNNNQQSAPGFWFSQAIYNFASDVVPVLQVNTYDKIKDGSVSIEVLKYQNDSDFLKSVEIMNSLPYWAVKDNSNDQLDSLKLEKISSFNSKVENTNDDYYYSYISFPAKMPEGQYLIRIKYGSRTFRTLLQVSDISTYISVCRDKTLVWLNDSITGKPLGDVTVSSDENQKAISGDDGLAFIDGKINIPEDTGYRIFKINNKNKPTFFAYVTKTNWYMNKDGEQPVNDLYWTYMYLDRGMYLPNDTVRIWGMVRPRDGTPMPEKAELVLYRYDYSYFEENDLPGLQTKEIMLTPSGFIKDEITLDNLASGSYSIMLKFGKRTIIESSFEVKEYTKPAYRINVEPDKKIAAAWEKVNFDIQASFFEGSPVPGIKLDYDAGINRHSNGVISCGDDGHGSLNFIPESFYIDSSWRPTTFNLFVNNNQSEEAVISSSGSVIVFPRDTMVEVKSEVSNNTARIKVETNLIDIDKAKEHGEMVYQDESFYKGKAADRRLKAKVYEKHWEQKVIGEYYDFINKRVEKKYEYKEVESVVKEEDFTTSNGVYEFSVPIEKNSKEYRVYYVKVTGADGKGRMIEEIKFINNYYNIYNSEFKTYSLVTEDGKNTYKLGEKAVIEVKYGGESLSKKPDTRVLFVVQRKGLAGYSISEDFKYSFEMDKNKIPNIYVKAVYFDGKNVYDAGNTNILYDYSEKELNVEVKPDKSDYKPGDTVNLDIEVNDKSGNPCPADVNISVVDEAFFAIQDQFVDTLGAIYSKNISEGEEASYFSYQPTDLNRFGGAECGEGGDKTIRSDFKDNAYFDTVKVGADGKAKANFKVPDNLTSWRITYQGVSDDLKAGNGKTNINVKLPFFADIIFNKIFMENDNPELTMRAFGTGVKSGDDVTYSVLLEGNNGVKKEFNKVGKVNLFTSQSLGSLKEGQYSVTVKVKCKNFNDGIKKDFSVVKNILEAEKFKTYKLADGLKIEGGKTLTTLEFYNAAISEFSDTLWSLDCTWGERVDQKLCRKLSQDLLKKYFQVNSMEENFEFTKYQLENGGIALLKYDSANPELSAKICAISEDEFDKSSLKLYFYKTIEDKESQPTDVAASFYGLASLNEPVLYDVKNLLASKGISYKDKIYLCLALAELGDIKTAREEYAKVTEGKLKKIDPLAYMDFGTSKDDIIEITALCSLVALKLDLPEKEGLHRYISQNSGRDIITNLERINYAMNTVPDTQKTSRFTYELDGKKKDVELKKADKFRIQLTSKSLEGIKFSNIQGEIAVTSTFKGQIKDSITEESKLVKLNRQYNGKNDTSFKQSDIVSITIKPEFSKAAPDGFYEITDVLPCGFRYVEGKEYVENRYYPDEVSGQKVVFTVYYSKNSKEKPKEIKYFARAVSPGDFTSDNAFIKHYGSSAAGISDMIKVKITR